MINQGVRCAKAECSNNGTCVVDQYFFEKDFQNLDYTSIFKKEQCVCDMDYQGGDCSEPFNAADEKIRESREKKIVNWTSVPISTPGFTTRKFGQWNRTPLESHYILNQNNADWLIFPNVFANDNWKNAVKTHGTKVVGIKRTEAQENKIVANPLGWDYSGGHMQHSYFPVCPHGYVRASFYIKQHHDGAPNFHMQYKNTDRHIHCLKEMYWIEPRAAQDKYEAETIVNEGIRDRTYNGRDYWTRYNWLTVPKTYINKMRFNKFDLSYNAPTYYPAHHNYNSNKNQKLIDFGHEHFYFHGDMKSFAEADAYYN